MRVSRLFAAYYRLGLSWHLILPRGPAICILLAGRAAIEDFALDTEALFNFTDGNPESQPQPPMNYAKYSPPSAKS